MRRDPAPSRFAYRLQRLWLTPLVRRALRIGPAVILVAAVIGYVAISPSTQDRMGDAMETARDSVMDREEFRVGFLQVAGASPTLDTAVTRLAMQHLPASSLALDVNVVRDQIALFPAVAEAAVRIGPGGVLEIDIRERVPQFVWRVGPSLKVLSEDGAVVGELMRRDDEPGLPLLIGAGADQELPEAVELMAAAEPIAPRLRALQRIGGRRWNVVLDRGQVLMLPEYEAIPALRRIMALQSSEEILERDITAVDFRDPDRTILRIGPFAQSEMSKLHPTKDWGANE